MSRTAFGRYELDRRLGAGGFGEVWKAWDPSLSRWVAIKLLKNAEPEELARFDREARTSAGLAHEGIAAVYDVGEVDGRPYIAMEYVDGVTLDRCRKDPRESAEAVRDAATAVQWAHDHGVIHRDLKPSNVMRDAGGRVRVLDFGLARSVEGGSTLTASGIMVGTPAYMSPEQARGERADERSDVYGLGATLYELLAGRAPFASGDIFSIVMRVIEEEAAPLRRLVPGISAELEAVVLKCLEKDPRRRYPSAREMAEDLDRWLRGERVTAGSAGGAARVLRRLARRGYLMPAALGAAILSGALILLVLRGKATTAADDAASGVLAELRRTSSTCLQAALDLRRMGNLDGMTRHAEQLEAACGKAMAEMPSSAEPYALLGRMRRAQMRNADAFVLQNEALKRDARHAPALYERVVLRGGQYRELLEALRRDEERRNPGVTCDIAAAAERSAEARGLRAAIAADLGAMPEGGSACTRAIARWAHGGIADAMAEFRRAVEADATTEEAWEWAAELHAQAYRWEEAERTLTTAISHDRGYVPFLEQRSQVRLRLATQRRNDMEARLRGYEPALDDAEAAVALAPRRAPSLMARGDARSGIGVLLTRLRRHDAATRFQGAIDDYSKALELGADRYEALVSRGGARENLGHLGVDSEALFRAAIADFDEGIRVNDARARAWSFRGGAWQGLAGLRADRGEDPAVEFEASIRDFDQALKRDPRDALTWLSRGSSLVARGRWEERRGSGEASLREAIRCCQEAAAVSPRSAEPWHRAGSVRLNLVHEQRDDPGEDYRLGMAELTKALDLDPRNAEAWQDRGGLQLNYSRWEERHRRDIRAHVESACSDFDRALDLAPALPHARRWRFHARCKMGGLIEASRDDPSTWLRGALADADLAFASGGADGLEWHRMGWAAYLLGVRSPPERVALYTRGAACLAEAVRIDPRNVGAWVQLGASRVNLGLASPVEKQEGLYRTGEEALTRAIELAPANAIARAYRGNASLNLAILLAGRGAANRAELEGALADYEEAMRLDPAWKSQVTPNAERIRKLLVK